MKIIRLNESQCKRLFEISSFVKTAGDEEGINGVTDNLDKGKVWTTSVINKNGEETHSTPPGGIGTNDPRQQVPGDTLYTIHGRGLK